MSEGVEWASHACILLASLPAGGALSAASIAAFNDLPKAYMAKQLQALAKSGVIQSVRGPKGGYRLARCPSDISLLDVRRAIEGADPDFICTNIRLRGPCVAEGPVSGPCAIARAFWEAEIAYQASLAKVTVADLMVAAIGARETVSLGKFTDWLNSQT